MLTTVSLSSAVINIITATSAKAKATMNQAQAKPNITGAACEQTVLWNSSKRRWKLN